MLRRAAAAALSSALLALACAGPAQAIRWKWPSLPKLPKLEGPTVAEAYGFDGGLTSLGLQLGAALPTGANGFSGAVAGGPAARLQLMRYLSSWIGVGVEAGIARFNRRNQSGGPVGPMAVPGATAETLRAQAATIDAVGRVNVFEQGSWTPYALGGGGLSYFSATGSASVPGAAPTALKGYTRGFHVTAAAGLELFLIRGMSASFEARYDQYPLDSRRFTETSAESLSYLVGLKVWYGGR